MSGEGNVSLQRFGLSKADVERLTAGVPRIAAPAKQESKRKARVPTMTEIPEWRRALGKIPPKRYIGTSWFRNFADWLDYCGDCYRLNTTPVSMGAWCDRNNRGHSLAYKAFNDVLDELCGQTEA